ncbi:MAG: hypothetical protein JOY78_00575 [Pseudonocardia sp.]|nr:hypothetical protein [Pseudonocardia sp.]
MTYVQISRSPGSGMDEYERVDRELGSAPIDGRADHHVGVVDGALVIVDVWRSRADADRFAAERLFPAFERAGLKPDAAVEITAFETTAAGARA